MLASVLESLCAPSSCVVDGVAEQLLKNGRHRESTRMTAKMMMTIFMKSDVLFLSNAMSVPFKSSVHKTLGACTA